MAMELPKETKLYRVKQFIARQKNIPAYFVARPLKQTAKAVYLYGHGTTETKQMGKCCVCNRTLTHPVSVALGIGPECGGHWWDWDAIGGYTEANLERLKGALRSIVIDTWVPKSMIEGYYDTEEQVQPPISHEMFKGEQEKTDNTPRQASLVKGVKNGKSYLKITFPMGANFKPDLATVKSLPGRKYHGDADPKFWTAPLSLEAVNTLRRENFEIDQGVLDWERSLTGNVDEIKDTQVQLPEGLYDFQKKGVAFLQAKNGRGLIADEMGLGKTVQALAYLGVNPDKLPALVVCPASVKYQWAKEAQKWLPAGTGIVVCNGTKPGVEGLEFIQDCKPGKKHMDSMIYIINYDILNKWTEFFKKARLQVMVADECHMFKNNKAQRTKAVKLLAKKVNHFIALSGTPIVNRPVEFYNALSCIEPGLYPSFWDYAQRFCGAQYTGWGWDFTGATNVEELHSTLVNTIMLRRKKADVLKDLPPKQIAPVPLTMSTKEEKEYRRIERDFIGWVHQTKGEAAAKQAKKAKALTKIGALKQAAMRAKLKAAIEWITDFINVNGKLVVWCTHTETIHRLMQVFDGMAVKIDGSIATNKRAGIIKQFAEDENTRLCICNIKAGGTGTDGLQEACSDAAFLELGWTPGEHSQAEDRLHRMGQDGDSVTAWYLLARGTIDETIAKLIDKKRGVLDQVLDGQNVAETSLISELMEEYKAAA